MQTKKFARLANRLDAEASKFCATSWDFGIMGTAFSVFDVPRRNFTWEQAVEKFAEIMHMPVDVARALELPDVPNELLKYVPAAFAIEQVKHAFNGGSAESINQRWRAICGM